MPGLVDCGVEARHRILRFFGLSGFHLFRELFQGGTQAAFVASICAPVFQVLSVRLQGRCMIGHSFKAPLSKVPSARLLKTLYFTSI
jgi:hypothetical protein